MDISTLREEARDLLDETVTLRRTLHQWPELGNDLPVTKEQVLAALDGKQIRLGGYPVPLENDARGRVTEFFLVPYPGACIHVPPPPPNQIVLVRYPKGMKIDDIYSPLWVTGKLKVEKVSNEMADAAYAMDDAKVRAVQESDL